MEAAVAKLTEAQLQALRAIEAFGGTGYPMRNAHRDYAPVRRLVRKQAIEKSGCRAGFTYFRLTASGRAALAKEDGQ